MESKFVTSAVVWASRQDRHRPGSERVARAWPGSLSFLKKGRVRSWVYHVAANCTAAIEQEDLES